MKFYLCCALLLAIVAIGIGYEMKKVRVKRSAMKRPQGFITIEMDDSHSGWGSGSSGWGSGGGGSSYGSESSGSGWGSGGGGGIQLSIKVNKKLDLGRMLGMLQLERDTDDGWGSGSSGWGSSSSGWGSGGGGSMGYGSGGGSSNNGWSYGSNGYDGGSGYRSRSARRSRS